MTSESLRRPDRRDAGADTGNSEMTPPQIKEPASTLAGRSAVGIEIEAPETTDSLAKLNGYEVAKLLSREPARAYTLNELTALLSNNTATSRKQLERVEDVLRDYQEELSSTVGEILSSYGLDLQIGSRTEYSRTGKEIERLDVYRAVRRGEDHKKLYVDPQSLVYRWSITIESPTIVDKPASSTPTPEKLPSQNEQAHSSDAAQEIAPEDPIVVIEKKPRRNEKEIVGHIKLAISTLQTLGIISSAKSTVTPREVALRINLSSSTIKPWVADMIKNGIVDGDPEDPNINRPLTAAQLVLGYMMFSTSKRPNNLKIAADNVQGLLDDHKWTAHTSQTSK